jgi:2-amino-4-hydroxy-6-hydroxymethyldihydropteridine diphosphokinase
MIAPADRTAFVALGSNLGDPRDTVLRAMGRLEELSDEPTARSSLWESEPVDCLPGSPKFVNAVVGLTLRKDETPESLLSKLRVIELEFGRQPKKLLNEPRPLDLDLIAFRAEIRNTPELVLPHPRAHQRRFVLQPLSEIAPALVLPGQSRSVADLLRALPQNPAVIKLANPAATHSDDPTGVADISPG